MLGGSWGSILMLAYAERHPNRVAEIVLFGVTTGRRKEFDWWFQWPPVPHLSPRFADPAFALAFARLVTHYVRHNA